MEVRLPIALNRIMRRYTVGNQMGQAHCALNAESLAHRGVAHIGVDQQHLEPLPFSANAVARFVLNVVLPLDGWWKSPQSHWITAHRAARTSHWCAGVESLLPRGGRAGDNHRRRTGISLIAQRPQYGSIDNSGNIRIAANTGVQQILDKGNHDAENDTIRQDLPPDRA